MQVAQVYAQSGTEIVDGLCAWSTAHTFDGRGYSSRNAVRVVEKRGRRINSV
jgi:hypothetical protein